MLPRAVSRARVVEPAGLLLGPRGQILDRCDAARRIDDEGISEDRGLRHADQILQYVAGHLRVVRQRYERSRADDHGWGTAASALRVALRTSSGSGLVLSV